MARERIAILASEDCKIKDNVDLWFGDSASADDPTQGDARMYSDGTHLQVRTVADAACIRLNSRDYAQTSGDSIGFQSKPAGTAASGTANVYGAQISPRFADGGVGASLVGALVEPILKGDSGNLSGDVRALELRFTDEGSAGRTIAGDMVGIQFFQLLAGHTISGDVCVLEVEAAGASSIAWEFFAKLPDEGQIAKSTQTCSTGAGWIKVKIGSATRYIMTYSDTPQ